MNYFDSEKVIYNHFLLLEDSEICLLGDDTENLLNIVRDKVNWIDNSKNTQNPPDFYNDKNKYMMEFFRVNDNNDDSNKNETRFRNYLYSINSDLKDKDLIVNALYETPCTYKNYFDSFKRTFQKHSHKIKEYKKAHPNYKVIFFVCDETQIYFESKEILKHELMPNEVPKTEKIHFHWMDERFINVIKNSGVDYVVWFTPFKNHPIYIQNNIFIKEKVLMPKAVILDKKCKLEAIRYRKEYMYCCESNYISEEEKQIIKEDVRGKK